MTGFAWIPVLSALTGGLVAGAAIGAYITYRLVSQAIDRTVSRADAVAVTNAALNAELDRVSVSLGGRLRDPDDPPLYAMPPGCEREKSCDEARLAWMDKCYDASVLMRARGLPEADDYFPVVIRANTNYMQAPPGPPRIPDQSA